MIHNGSEFNCIHFGIEIIKRLQFLTPKNVWVRILDPKTCVLRILNVC